MTWFTIKMVLVLSIINGWSSRHMEFVLSFTRDSIEFDSYMEIPPGIKTEEGIRTENFIKLLKNLYGLRQVSRVKN